MYFIVLSVIKYNVSCKNNCFFFFVCLSTFLYDVKCCSCCVVVFLSIYKFKILVFLLWRLVYRYVFLRSKFKGCKSLGLDCHINK